MTSSCSDLHQIMITGGDLANWWRRWAYQRSYSTAGPVSTGMDDSLRT